MTDGFDAFLAGALAPPTRDPDSAFVLRVRAQCALDERLRAQRRGLVRMVLLQAFALAAVGAGLAWLGKAAPVSALLERAPWIGLGAVLALFGLLVVTIAAPGRDRAGA